MSSRIVAFAEQVKSYMRALLNTNASCRCVVVNFTNESYFVVLSTFLNVVQILVVAEIVKI